MFRRLLLALCVLALSLGALGDAAASDAARVGSAEPAQEFLAKVDAAAAAGRITAEQALLFKLQYGFEPGRLPEEFRPTVFSPLKCGTQFIVQYERDREQLSSATRALIEKYLAPKVETGVDKAIYFSPGGKFQLNYATEGTHAVPLLDADSNGVPDYVEKVAGYLDYSWTWEIDTLGFLAPPLTTNNRYQIYFESMQYYGYTSALASPYGATRITLHNNFIGFPPNTDPEGNQWGAAKVTCAHEFKHASQRIGSMWSEGGWVEVDATWMEESAYDYVNDYYNYLPGASPIRQPSTPLDSGGSGSYEDCVWQIWMDQTWGPQLLVDLWQWRRTHQAEPMMDSYERMLLDYGTTLASGWLTFTGWNYATNTRAITGFGYEEAALYPIGPVAGTATSYPYTRAGTVSRLAANWIRCNNLSTAPGSVRVTFNGSDGAGLRLGAVIRKNDGTGVLEEIPLDSANDADATLSVPRDQIAALGFTIAYGAKSGVTLTYSITVDQADLPVPAATISAAYVTTTLERNTTGSETLVIGNEGEAGSTLVWSIAVEDPSKDIGWLTPVPASGEVLAGATEEVELQFDATGLTAGTYLALLVVTHNAAGSPVTLPVELTVTDTVSGVDRLPRALRVEGNHPNPFNPSTTIALSIPRDGPATVEVLDLQGRVVRVLFRGDLTAGGHSLVWDGRDGAGRLVASGGYLARLTAAGGAATHKMMLAK